MSEPEIVDLEEQFNSFFPVREFSSFEEFEKTFREFQRATATSYVFNTSTSRELWQRRRKEVIPESFRYKYVCLRCIHSSKKKRKPSTLYRFEDYNCPSKITLGYRKNKMHFIHTDLKHNHPIAEGNPEFYSKNRRLSPEQEAILHRVLDGGFTPGQIIEYIYVNFGIRINMLDLRHILDRKRKIDQMEGEEVSVSSIPVQPVLQPEPEVPKPETTIIPVSITTPVVNTFPCSVLMPTFVNSQEQTLSNKRHLILQVVTELYNAMIQLDDGLVDEHLSFIKSYTTHLTQSQCAVETVNIVREEPPVTSGATATRTPARSSSAARPPPKRSVKRVSEVKPQLADIAPRPIAPRPAQSNLRPILPRPPDRPKVAIPVTVVPVTTNLQPTDIDGSRPRSQVVSQPSLDVTYDDENDEEEEAMDEHEEEEDEEEDEEDEDEDDEDYLHEENASSSSDEFVMSNNMNSLNHSYIFTRNFASRRKPVLVTRGSPIEIIDEYIHR